MRWFTELKRLYREEKAAAAVLTVIMLTSLVALVGAAVDMGIVYAARSELQNATDSAAMASAAELLVDANNDGAAETNYSGAQLTAEAYVESNQMLTEPLQWNQLTDVFQAGLWDFDLGDFAQTGDSSDPADLDTVRVAMNRPVDLLFARVVGVRQVSVGAAAVGHLGCAGNGGKADLPLAINAAALDSLGPDTDIVLNSENAENGQWTSFQTWPCNNNTIGAFLDDPSQIPPLNIGDKLYMNNGEIANLFGDLADLFAANAGPDGTWPVMLPVVQWSPPQNEGTLIGFVHFVITEVRGPGGPSSESKRIIGYWEDDAALVAPGAATGGQCYGVRASRSTLIK